MKKKKLKRKNLNNPQIKSYAKAVRKGLSGQHVIPVKNNGWGVKKAGSSRLSRVFDKQEQAIKYGKRIARHNRTELFVHKSDGRIKSRKSYF